MMITAMADPITFTTRLTDAEWDEVMGGWRCPVLQIPGAEVEDIYVDGNQIDHGRFLVLQGQHIIRWMSPERPKRVAVIIKLTKELALGSDTDKWKKRAVILPFVATIAAASITALPTYWSKLLDSSARMKSLPTPGKSRDAANGPEESRNNSSRMPQWLPRYPKAETQQVTSQGNIVTYSFASRDSTESVQNFYASHLLLRGMKPSPT
jgi:hypothetical protein